MKSAMVIIQLIDEISLTRVLRRKKLILVRIPEEKKLSKVYIYEAYICCLKATNGQKHTAHPIVGTHHCNILVSSWKGVGWGDAESNRLEHHLPILWLTAQISSHYCIHLCQNRLHSMLWEEAIQRFGRGILREILPLILRKPFNCQLIASDMNQIFRWCKFEEKNGASQQALNEIAPSTSHSCQVTCHLACLQHAHGPPPNPPLLHLISPTYQHLFVAVCKVLSICFQSFCDPCEAHATARTLVPVVVALNTMRLSKIWIGMTLHAPAWISSTLWKGNKSSPLREF